MDIVLDRAAKGICPICKCKFEKDTPHVNEEYNGILVKVCYKHVMINLQKFEDSHRVKHSKKTYII